MAESTVGLEKSPGQNQFWSDGWYCVLREGEKVNNWVTPSTTDWCLPGPLWGFLPAVFGAAQAVAMLKR